MASIKTLFVSPDRLRIGELFKLIRWRNLLIIALSQYMTAIFLVGPATEFLAYLKDVKLLLICIGTILIAAAGYIINDYYDVKIDYVNRPKKVVVDKVLKRRAAMFFHTGLNLAGIAIGLLVSFKIALVNLVAAVWLWAYSNQLKRMPFVGNFSVALLSSLAIAIIGLHYGGSSKIVYFYAIFAFFISLIREIIKDIEDLKGDATFGCKTLPVVWGIRTTKAVVYVLFFLFSIILAYLAYIMDNQVLNYYFILLLFPGIYLFYKLVIADTIKEFRALSSYLKWFMLLGIISMIFV